MSTSETFALLRKGSRQVSIMWPRLRRQESPIRCLYKVAVFRTIDRFEHLFVAQNGHPSSALCAQLTRYYNCLQAAAAISRFQCPSNPESRNAPPYVHYHEWISHLYYEVSSKVLFYSTVYLNVGTQLQVGSYPLNAYTATVKYIQSPISLVDLLFYMLCPFFLLSAIVTRRSSELRCTTSHTVSMRHWSYSDKKAFLPMFL